VTPTPLYVSLLVQEPNVREFYLNYLFTCDYCCQQSASHKY